MKKGKHLFRGLSAALAVLMLICMSLTTLTLGNTTWINSNLNIQDTKTIGGSDEFAVYWANDYGYDSTALIEVYYDAADANVEIAQEGMTLLKNDNAALPLADGTRFTIFGNAAVTPISTATVARTTSPMWTLSAPCRRSSARTM